MKSLRERHWIWKFSATYSLSSLFLLFVASIFVGFWLDNWTYTISVGCFVLVYALVVYFLFYHRKEK